MTCPEPFIVRLLGFGSSGRRGSRPYTDPRPWRALIDACVPDFVGHGDSPCGGGDTIVDNISRPHFTARGLDPKKRVLRFPWNRIVDGTGNDRFMRRNGRMDRAFMANLAAGLVVGKVGEAVGTNGCYLSNGSEDMARRLRARKVPLIIYRENGVEPFQSPEVALVALRQLYAVTREPALVPLGLALASHISSRLTMAAEVRGELNRAKEAAPRFAPWLEPILATLGSPART